jgi:hypothetical protein
MSTETAQQLLTLLVPFAPIIITYLVKEYHYTSEQKFYIAMFVSAIVGALQAYVQGEINGEGFTVDSVIQNVLTVAALSQVYYRTLYKRLEKLVDPREHLTSELKDKEIRPKIEMFTEGEVQSVVKKDTDTSLRAKVNLYSLRTGEYEPERLRHD